MATTTTGTFYVAKDRGANRPAALARRDDSNAFVLQLRVIDSQGYLKKEIYTLRWTGAEAEAWWSANAPLKAGDALALVVENPRAMTDAGDIAPSIHAQVISCSRKSASASTPPAQPA